MMTCFSIIFSWIVLLLSIVLVSKCNKQHPSDADDGMGKIDKDKITMLAEELLKDCKIKQRQVHIVREEQRFFVAYDVGLVMGKIREKYKRMMTIYRMSVDRKNNRSDLIPPGIRDYKTIHWILDMERVHFLQVDIDKLIHVLETIPNETLHSQVYKEKLYKAMSFRSDPDKNGKPPVNINAGGDKNGPQPRVLRTSSKSSNTGISPNPIIQNENDLKQHYREQYKARSGHRGNWTLDEYYGVI